MKHRIFETATMRQKWGVRMNQTQLIVMLTHNDYTVADATAVFEACRHTPVQYWGAKEQGIAPDRLKRLFDAVNAAGKYGVLEVVSCDESACLAGAETAIACGCRMLLGTRYFDSVNALCRQHNIRYMPFVGTVSQRPSILEGSAADMIDEARRYAACGVHGIDLLGYRYVGDADALCRSVIEAGGTAVCLAGSINSVERLAQVRALQPSYFTIGSAFFEHRFGESIPEQIAFVCRYMNGEEGCEC